MTRLVQLLALLLGTLVVTGCATPMLRPQLADDPTALDEQADVAFAPERVLVRQPGASIGESVEWVQSIQDYTAESLNTLASTSTDADEASAPMALRTEVVFDVNEGAADFLADDQAVRVALSTTFPDGRQVHTERKGTLEDPTEVLAEQACAVSGPVLDAVAFAGVLFLLSTTTLAAMHPMACGCLVGTALTGLAANVGHQGLAHYFRMKKEERLSQLYADALQEHAQHVVAMAKGRVPPPLSTETPLPTQLPGLNDDAAPPPPMTSPPAEDPSTAPPVADDHGAVDDIDPADDVAF